MTEEGSWKIPSFTCSLNFVNCRLRSDFFSKQLSSSLKFLNTSEGDTMDDVLSDHLDDISGDEGDIAKKNDGHWSSCRGHDICAMGTDNDDDDDSYFNLSPESPNEEEIVINPPVPLPPLIESKEKLRKLENNHDYGTMARFDLSFKDNGSEHLDCDSGCGSSNTPAVEVPKLLTAVSSHLSVLIGSDDSESFIYCRSKDTDSLTTRSERSSHLESDSSLVECCNSDEIRRENCAESESSKFRGSENSGCEVGSSLAESSQTREESDGTSDECGTSIDRAVDIDLANLNAVVLVEDFGNDQGDMQEGDETDESSDDGGGGQVVTLQRSTSLKTGRASPITPTTKKIVRFADAMGLDLEAVKQIVQDDLPTVPKSAYVDLELPEIFDSPVDSPVGSFSNSGFMKKMYVPFEPSKFEQLNFTESVVRNLQCQFIAPGMMPNFLQRVTKFKVCLEKVSISDLSINCVVRVVNVHYEKKLVVRFTTNEWASFNEINAIYVQGSNDLNTDQFSFTICAPYLSSGQRLSFAIKYQSAGDEYWDNNFGANYCFKCQSELATLNDESSSWLHFL